jgi:hypothetical protein
MVSVGEKIKLLLNKRVVRVQAGLRSANCVHVRLRSRGDQKVEQGFSIISAVNQGDLDELATQIRFELFIAVKLTTLHIPFERNPSALKRSLHEFTIERVEVFYFEMHEILLVHLTLRLIT